VRKNPFMQSEVQTESQGQKFWPLLP
jgi:hypothetical protein